MLQQMGFQSNESATLASVGTGAVKVYILCVCEIFSVSLKVVFVWQRQLI